MADFDNMVTMIESENVDPFEKEFANAIEESVKHCDLEFIYHPRGNSSEQNEFRDFSHDNAIPRQDRLFESMETFTNGINLRRSQEMDSMMSMMKSQIKGTINSAISERVIPEIHNIVSSMSSGHMDNESRSSVNNQEDRDETTWFEMKITKRTVGLPLI